MSGYVVETLEPTGEEDARWFAMFHPQFVEPPPMLFPIPRSTSGEVVEAVRSAFSFYWSDRDACVTRLRTVAELFLTAEGVPGGDGAFVALSKRLDEYEQKNPILKEELEALKWLGNAGTHELGAINLKSVNDALQMISRVFDVVYGGVATKEVAREINQRKGPRSST